MVLTDSSGAPITCTHWDELVAEDGFLALGRNRYPCDYVIYTDGTYYYAENGTTGVLDYGGPNNIGVTGTNFRDVFQAAINALAAGKICIGEGFFDWDDDITIDDRKTIYGSGTDVTILRRTVANKTITLLSGVAWTEGIHLNDMTIHGNSLAGTLVSVASSRSVSLERVRITSSAGTGLHVPAGSWGTKCLHCWFDQNDVGALLEANFIQINNCIARMNDACNIRITSDGHGVRITNTIVEFVQDAGAWNLEIQGGAFEAFAEHVILSSHFENAPAAGGDIRIFNSSAVDIAGVKILGCYISEDNVGIQVEDAVDTKIIDNHIRGVGTGVNVLATATRTLIAMNELYATTPYADAGTDTLVLDNPGYNPQAASVPAVGGSPVVFGPYVYPMMIGVVGGTITSVTIRAQATGQAGAGTFAYYSLYPGDTCTIVYTIVPVIYLYPQ